MFELHITVDTDNFAKFEDVCNILEIKALNIQNYQGKHPNQMLCSYQSTSAKDIDAMITCVDELCKPNNISILRRKIETPIQWNYAGIYSEMHIKLLAPTHRHSNIVRFCNNNLIALGWDLNLNENGLQKYFLTIRDHNELPNQKYIFEQILAKTKMYFLQQFTGVSIETVILDDNLGLDEDWL